jgi:hypothetical protein
VPTSENRQAEQGAQGKDVDDTLEIGSSKYSRAECAGESYESSVQTEKVGTAVSKVWRAEAAAP